MWSTETIHVTTGGSIGISAGAPTAVAYQVVQNSSVFLDGGVPIQHIAVSGYSGPLTCSAAAMGVGEALNTFQLYLRALSGTCNYSQPFISGVTQRRPGG
jgi:hypothetical protein